MRVSRTPSRCRFVLLRGHALLAVAFVAAVCFVFKTHAQTADSVNDRLRAVESKQAVLDAEVRHLEAANIEHRLSTEEADLQLVLKLTYVVTGGVFLELVLQALRLRNVHRRDEEVVESASESETDDVEF
jgi:hypothetical protein